MDGVPDRHEVPDMDEVLDMDGIPESRWDTRLWVGYHIMDGVPDRGGVPGGV